MAEADLIALAPLFSAGAILLSASIALGVFIYTRRANRRRATLDMVLRTFLDENSTKLYDEFKTVIRRDQSDEDDLSLVDLVAHTPANEADRNTVIDQLNSYELVSLGIRQGLFDEAFYKRWFHFQFTKDFESVEAFVSKVQEIRPSQYCEFRALYNRWKKNRHPVNHPRRIQMMWWAMNGDFKKLEAASAGKNH